MSSQLLKGILAEDIPKKEEFASASEEELPPLDYNLIINGLSSIPLYERMNLNKESLSEEELKLMDIEAKRYDACYEQKVKTPFEDKDVESCQEESSFKSKYMEDEGNIELFLKYMFNNSGNDGLVSQLMKKPSLDDILQDSSSKVDLFDVKKSCTPSKEFSEFLLNIKKGMHDDFIMQTLSSHDSNSELSSEETDEAIERIAKKMSRKLKFSESANSKSLDHIINAKKHDIFELIAESSSKKPVLPKNTLFQSESDSEKEEDIRNKTKKTKNDGTCREKVFNKKQGWKKSQRAVEPKRDTNDCNKPLNKSDKSKLDCPKNSKEKKNLNNFPQSCSNTRGLSQQQGVTADHINKEICSEKVNSGTVVINSKQSAIVKDSLPKNKKQEKKNSESSDSSDEDWEKLAEKSLLSRSRTIEQKATKIK